MCKTVLVLIMAVCGMVKGESLGRCEGEMRRHRPDLYVQYVQAPTCEKMRWMQDFLRANGLDASETGVCEEILRKEYAHEGCAP